MGGGGCLIITHQLVFEFLLQGQILKKLQEERNESSLWSVCVQIQKRSGAWFYKGRDQQLLPTPFPLSKPAHSESPEPGGRVGARPANSQLHGSSRKCLLPYKDRSSSAAANKSSIEGAADVLSPQSRSSIVFISSSSRLLARNNRNRQQEQRLTAVTRPSLRQQP